MNEVQQEFERAFSGEMSDSDNTASPDSGYGITPDPLQYPGDVDYKKMASEFNAASEPVVGSIGATEDGDGAAVSSAAISAPVALTRPVKGSPLPPVPESMPQFKTFGQAFKYHREQAMNGGPSTFDWNGKKFTTRIKSEVGNIQKVQRSRATVAPAASSRAGQSKHQAIAASVPIAAAPQTRPAAAFQQVKPLHVRQQEAYDEWQRQLSASKTWWGGQATLGPFQKERLQEAEKRFEKLLSETK